MSIAETFNSLNNSTRTEIRKRFGLEPADAAECQQNYVDVFYTQKF